MSLGVVKFESEADMVARFCELVSGNTRDPWTIYPETGGWDLLLVHDETGVQLGIEAKLTLNAKVVCQALPQSNRWSALVGPDFRSVMVPSYGLQVGMAEIVNHLGLNVITMNAREGWNGKITYDHRPWELPDPRHRHTEEWVNWFPETRCSLPEYVPDVTGGKAAPVMLTPWKVKAIRLMIVLERRGYVTRADMRLLQLSASRWTDCWHGFLALGDKGYVACGRTPDFKAQHPRNWAEIEADIDKWSTGLDLKTGGTLL